MSFARLFIDIAVPRLRQRARFLGHMVAGECHSWPEAVTDLYDHARRLGLTHLETGRMQQTEDWMLTELLAAVDAAESIWEEERARSDRIMAQLQPHFAWCDANE